MECIAIPFSRGSSQPGIEHRSPALQADSLPSEPPCKSPIRNFLKNLMDTLGLLPGRNDICMLDFNPTVQRSWRCSGTPSQRLSVHITSSHQLQMGPGPSHVKVFLQAALQMGASPRPSPLSWIGEGLRSL